MKTVFLAAMLLICITALGGCDQRNDPDLLKLHGQYSRVDWDAGRINLFKPGKYDFNNGQHVNSKDWLYTTNALMVGSGAYKLEILENNKTEVVFYDADNSVTIRASKTARYLTVEDGIHKYEFRWRVG